MGNNWTMSTAPNKAPTDNSLDDLPPELRSRRWYLSDWTMNIEKHRAPTDNSLEKQNENLEFIDRILNRRKEHRDN